MTYILFDLDETLPEAIYSNIPNIIYATPSKEDMYDYVTQTLGEYQDCLDFDELYDAMLDNNEGLLIAIIGG